MTFQQTSCSAFQRSNERILLKTFTLMPLKSYKVTLHTVLITFEYTVSSHLRDGRHLCWASPISKGKNFLCNSINCIYFHVKRAVVSFDTVTKTRQVKTNVSPKSSLTFYRFWTQEKFLHQQHLLARNLTSCIEKQILFCLLWAWHFSCIWHYPDLTYENKTLNLYI